MKINPTGNQVAIRPIKQAPTTPGGVHLPDTALKLLNEGVVLELGPKVDQSLYHQPIGPGTHVAYSRYAGSWLKIAREGDSLVEDDERNVKLVEDEDVLSVPSDG
jgi:co-chaperonin GroES (HSP10)